MAHCIPHTAAKAAIISLLTFSSVLAQAAYVVHSDQGSLNAAVGGALIIENLDSDSGSGSPISLSGTDLTSVSSDANQIFHLGAGVFGGQTLKLQDSGAWSATFTLDKAARAFGFEVIDYFETGNATMSFSTSAGESGVLLTAGPLSNLNTQYMGFVTDLHFNTVTISGTLGDGAEYDNFAYAVDEPSTLTLAGFLALLVLRRHAKKSNRQDI